MSVPFSEDNPHEWDWDNNPERWTKHRARFIERTTDFDSTASEIIAWAELGYSHSGISMYVDVGMSTVKSRMNDIDEQDPTALLARRPGEIEVESSVGIDGTDLATGGDE
jgi:hypothetical protein